MDTTTITLLLGILAGFIAGAIIGALIGNRSAKKQEEEPALVEEAQETKLSPAGEKTPEIEEPVLEPPAVLTSRTREGFIPLVCFWRGKETGNLAAEIKGKLYLEPAPLGAELKGKLEQIGREWLAWLGVESEKGAHEPVVDAVESPQKTTAAVEYVVDAMRPAGVEPLKELVKGEIKAKSMIEQIDEILQEKLSRSGLSNRGIRIMEDALSQGVSVWVGLTRYSSIDEVKDEQARALINEAVHEWERRSGAKRGA